MLILIFEVFIYLNLFLLFVIFMIILFSSYYIEGEVKKIVVIPNKFIIEFIDKREIYFKDVPERPIIEGKYYKIRYNYFRRIISSAQVEVTDVR